ncbi:MULTISPECIES: ABC transporter permease [Nocardia]|uniref:ABC transporter permease n=1 Tax=Nocardia TaxID=1817 RepID=UPI001E3DA909|nr:MULTISPECIES: ABC transporter permease [Nocardia]
MTTRTPRARRPLSSATGTGTLLSFALRRERVALPAWLIGAIVLLAMQSLSSQRLYDTATELAQLRETMGANAATVALGGPIRLLDTIGGEILFEIFAYLAIVIALMNMFLIVRHTRSDEEAGRDELIRSARVGRRAPALAALAVALVADLAVAVTVFGAAVATGLPAAGSLLLGVSVAGVGLTFASITTLAAQVFENPRGVYGAVTLVLAASYVARAVGDVGDGTLSWASPLGWGQRTYPYVVDRWWPVTLFVLSSAVLVTAAFVLLDRRDFGAGLLSYGTGPADASWALGSPLGLAWRLQRGSWIGWCVGVFALGAAYGSFADSIADYLADNPEIAAFLPGGAADAVDSYLALSVSMTSLLAAAYGITAVLRARGEETAGHAEALLAAPVGRTRWLAGHVAIALLGGAAVAAAGGFGIGLAHALTVGDRGQALRMTAAAAVYWPAAWSIAAVAVIGFGWMPRAAAILAWTIFGYCVVALLFADSFDLPNWFAVASAFEHTPTVPLDDVTAAGLSGIGVFAVLVLLAGFAGFRRRDTGY